jgi:hypothetical protein
VRSATANQRIVMQGESPGVSSSSAADRALMSPRTTPGMVAERVRIRRGPHVSHIAAADVGPGGVLGAALAWAGEVLEQPMEHVGVAGQ